MKLVVEDGRFKSLNIGFKDYNDNFLGFFSLGFDVGLLLGNLDWILSVNLLVITDFVVFIGFWTLFSFPGFYCFIPYFRVDF